MQRTSKADEAIKANATGFEHRLTSSYQTVRADYVASNPLPRESKIIEMMRLDGQRDHNAREWNEPSHSLSRAMFY